jgi:hypothetical protein
MPKKISTLEHEIADWQHYKKYGKWLDGKKPYRPFTHSDADEQIAKREAQIAKLKAKSGGTRHRRGTRSTRRRRGGNRFPPIQKHTYRNYDKHLSEADAAKEAAQAEEERQHANETRRKYMADAEKPFSRIAVGKSPYTLYRLRVASRRRKAKGLPN